MRVQNLRTVYLDGVNLYATTVKSLVLGEDSTRAELRIIVKHGGTTELERLRRAENLIATYEFEDGSHYMARGTRVLPPMTFLGDATAVLKLSGGPPVFVDAPQKPPKLSWIQRWRAGAGRWCTGVVLRVLWALR